MGEQRKCLCRCGGTTKGGSFLPGHDARYKSDLIKEALAGGNPEAEQILAQRGWTKFLDKAREVAARPKSEPRAPKVEEEEGGALRRLHVLKAAAKVLRMTDQYAKAAGQRRIELTIENLEPVLTLQHPKLDRSRLADIDPETSQAEYFGWEPHETEAVEHYLRLAQGRVA